MLYSASREWAHNAWYTGKDILFRVSTRAVMACLRFFHSLAVYRPGGAREGGGVLWQQKHDGLVDLCGRVFLSIALMRSEVACRGFIHLIFCRSPCAYRHGSRSW